jgi:hypothetical protein
MELDRKPLGYESFKHTVDVTRLLAVTLHTLQFNVPTSPP